MGIKETIKDILDGEINKEKELEKGQKDLIETIGACALMMSNYNINTETISMALHKEVDSVVDQLIEKGELEK